MKRNLISFAAVMLFLIQNVVSQSPMIITENFDGTVLFSQLPANSWRTNTDFYVSAPNSYHAEVPSTMGDSAILMTGLHDFSNFNFVQLRFSHICKISPQDIARIEYRTGRFAGFQSPWRPLWATSYKSEESLNYLYSLKFSSENYPEWMPNDSLIPPKQSWWKEEYFDISDSVAGQVVEFRFVLRRGATIATNVSYGWLLDNIEIKASDSYLSRPTVKFVAPLVNGTLYNIGPHAIKAEVTSTSSSPIKQPWLKYVAINNGIEIANDSILMNVSEDGFWQAKIPQLPVGTEVTYSIKGEDVTGNYSQITSGYTIEKMQGAESGYVTIGTGTIVNNSTPIAMYFNYSWTQQLYTATEIDPQGAGGLITELAWDFVTAYTRTYPEQTCWMKVVDYDYLTQHSYVDPIADGAIQVWAGTLDLTTAGWVSITLDKPFLVPPGKNLLIYWDNKEGTYASGYNWNHTKTSKYQTLNRQLDANFPITGDGSLSYDRPNVRLYREKLPESNHSAALISIDNPTYRTIVAGTQNPIVLTIRNKGNANLDSATIYWSINNTTPQSYIWRGDLSWDFEAQDTIGYFIPRADMYDTLKVWVSMPNGKIDSATYDDTLRTILYGCTQSLAGSYVIGEGKAFNSLEDVLLVANKCGVTGNVTLSFASDTINKAFDLSNLSKIIKPYTLTITSEKGRDSVVLKPSSGPAIILDNSSNIIIKDITIDVAAGTNGVQFGTACSDIVVRDCKIIAKRATSATAGCGVYKAATGIPATNISIINNKTEGGYAGIYFIGGTSSSSVDFGNNIIIDSNEITNSYYYGVHLEKVWTSSVADNKITPGLSTGTTWSGINKVNTSSLPASKQISYILRNKIYSNVFTITGTLKGIVVSYIDTALIANNEIYLNSKASTTRGIDFQYTRATDLMYNTVLLEGTGGSDFRAFYWYIINNASWDATVQYNIFAVNGGQLTTAYAIYTQSYPGARPTQYRLNNNCYYSSGLNLGYADGAIRVDLAAWKGRSPNDANSINLFPEFINQTNDLKLSLSSYARLLCDTFASVTHDKEMNLRSGKTTMGCYQGIATTDGAMLVDILGLREGSVSGQEDSVMVTVLNTGRTTITDVQLSWSYNGTTQTVSRSVNLEGGESVAVGIGKLLYPIAPFTVKVWIDNLNSGTLTDLYHGDDTLTSYLYICDAPLSGAYVIGENRDFENLNQAINSLKLCGVSDDVSFEFIDGTYNQNWEFFDLGDLMGDNMLTITSESKQRSSVILQPASNAAIVLKNVKNIEFKYLTIDTKVAENHGIQFFDKCSNILVDNCNILLNINSKDVYNANYGAIYKGASTDIVNNIRITNNLLNGGYYGVYINASSANLTNDIIIDNNIIGNQYQNAIRLNYSQANSISSNIISSRYSGNTSTQWQGIHMNYSNGPIMNNRISQEYTSITQPTGIHLNFYHNNDVQKAISGVVANNEIVISGTYSSVTQQYGGVVSLSSNVRILHNSIYAKGSGAVKGLYLHNAAVFMEVKNNNLVAEQSTSYPIFITKGSTFYDINSNNYKSPQYIGAITEDYPTLPSSISDFAIWKQRITTDTTSVSVSPNFTAIASSLKLADSTGLSCPYTPYVEQDIEKMYRRNDRTTMGCYDAMPPYDGNIKLLKIIGLPSKLYAGDKDSVKVVVTNTGSSQITNVELGWKLDNVQQTAVSRSVSINRGEMDTLYLAEVTYPNNSFEFAVWSQELNLGGLIDANVDDDTLSTYTYVCDSVYNGIYTVGQGGNFDNLNQALDAFKLCGINANIELQFLNNTYNQTWEISDMNFPYTITITSQAKDRNTVIVKPVSDAAIILTNVSNVIFNEITIDATAGAYGIRLNGKCANVTVDNCNIFLDSTTSPTQFSAIDKFLAADKLNGLRITNNLIQGGNAGVSLEGSTANYNQNVIIDSNVFCDQNYYALDLAYTNANRVSHNTFLSRVNTTSDYWIAINVNRGNIPVISNNRIRQRNNTTVYATGMSLYYFNFNTTMGLVANNEIIIHTPEREGIRIQASNAKVLHNSIYVDGDGTQRGITEVETRSIAVDLEIRNNNIVTTSLESNPLYLGELVPSWNINSNNYYAPQYIGNGMVDMEAWTSLVPSDIASTTIAPIFDDINKSLKLTNAFAFQCSSLVEVPTDINGETRLNNTALGAYTLVVHDTSYVEMNMYNWQDETVLNKQHPIEVSLTNASRIPISSITFDWTLNGAPQQSYQWFASNPLGIYDNATILVDFFTVAQNNNAIQVWVSEINGSTYFGEKLDAECHIVPLAKFVAPIVADTVNNLSFDVYTNIYHGSGADINTPQLMLQTLVNGTVWVYDTVDMTPYNNSVWVAAIPQQYYNSKVIYSTTIVDTVGNEVTLIDSTFIQYTPGDQTFEPYAGYNLSLLSMTEPAHVTLDCSPDFASLKVLLANLGENDYDFAENHVTLHVRITGAVEFYTNTVLYKDKFNSKDIKTVEIVQSLSIMEPGQYNIKIWIESDVDNIPYDDTLAVVYVSGRISLPIDEDFDINSTSDEFISEEVNTLHKWEVVAQGYGNDTAVRPTSGGMIAFIGSPAAMSTLSTRQLALYGTTQPTLEFWYFHDTIKTSDYTNVYITTDGNDRIKLVSVNKYNTAYGWKRYEADLSPYTNGTCISVIFEAMEKSLSGNVAQYIDRIRIVSKQDIAILDVFPSNYSTCDLKNKTWKVVLANVSPQRINFANNPTAIRLDIVGTSHSFTYPLNRGSFEGLAIDTITMTTGFDLLPADYNVVASIVNSIDENPANDRFAKNIIVKPEFTIVVETISTSTNFALAGIRHNQVVTIKNTGNMDLPAIGLILRIESADQSTYPYSFTTKDTIAKTLVPGEVMSFSFNEAYNIPFSPRYNVMAYAYLLCDSIMSNVQDSKTEDVNMNDIYVASIERPLDNGVIDAVGSQMEVEVKIQNRNPGRVYVDNEVKAGILITDVYGTPIGNAIIEGLPSIEANAGISYTFLGKYTVPNLAEYYLVVYIENMDQYKQNDTLKILRQVQGVSNAERVGAFFTLEQNMPNPAKDKTTINYSIPQDGEVMFNLYSVSGQLLHSQKETVTLGNHQIELKLSDYASGIYFYTMEYNGQRLTKRMSIKR